jgi:4-hydroxy-tetrahydrodipicolinate synthase
MLAMGGMGCISVLSNVVPKESVEMCDKFFAGDVSGAAALQLKLLELVNCLFCEVNPIPVKAAISAMGFGTEHLRLPLTPMEEPQRSKLYEEMRKLGIEV